MGLLTLLRKITKYNTGRKKVNEEMNSRLDALSDAIKRAQLNGENGWFLVMERHGKKGDKI